MKAVVIIPAQQASSGVITSTVAAAKQHFETIVTTDDSDIYSIVKEYNEDTPCVMITGVCNSGTERVRRAVQYLERFSFKPNWDIIINWQANEWECDGQYIINALREFKSHEADIITLAVPATPSGITSPDIVKVVIDHQNMAMYFSRSPIPYNGEQALKHIGIYAFRHDILAVLGTLDDTAYPSEKLEQVQWLESGLKIKVCVVPSINARPTAAENLIKPADVI